MLKMVVALRYFIEYILLEVEFFTFFVYLISFLIMMIFVNPKDYSIEAILVNAFVSVFIMFLIYIPLAILFVGINFILFIFEQILASFNKKEYDKLIEEYDETLSKALNRELK